MRMIGPMELDALIKDQDSCHHSYGSGLLWSIRAKISAPVPTTSIYQLSKTKQVDDVQAPQSNLRYQKFNRASWRVVGTVAHIKHIEIHLLCRRCKKIQAGTSGSASMLSRMYTCKFCGGHVFDPHWETRLCVDDGSGECVVDIAGEAGLTLLSLNTQRENVKPPTLPDAGVVLSAATAPQMGTSSSSSSALEPVRGLNELEGQLLLDASLLVSFAERLVYQLGVLYINCSDWVDGQTQFTCCKPTNNRLNAYITSHIKAHPVTGQYEFIVSINRNTSIATGAASIPTPTATTVRFQEANYSRPWQNNAVCISVPIIQRLCLEASQVRLYSAKANLSDAWTRLKRLQDERRTDVR
jgi:hypothetical protein